MFKKENAEKWFKSLPTSGAELIERTVNELSSVVDKIENEKFPTTQNHYGDYMGIIQRLGETKNQRATIAVCLILAGANEQGVISAFKLSV